MIVNLRQLDEAVESQGRLTSAEIVQYVDAFDKEITINCQVELTYDRSGGAYFFRGRLKGKFQTQCHVCLVEVPCDVEGDFEVVVRKLGGRENETNQHQDADDSEDVIVLGLKEYEVSFDHHISENLIVNVPMQIACRKDCKGICTQCGTNRNDKQCDCGESADPRWDVLRKLKNE